MNNIKIAVFGLGFVACKPNVDEPIDEEAYALCDALYEQARGCGVETDDEDVEKCSEQRPWNSPCRTLQKEQFECYAALSCDDKAANTPAFKVCEEKLHRKSECYASER
ncbi:MAG: hypothetical protein IAG13_06370 [Deltaproteobacteria bacterium]|nr:hypothetical protein [Nannocystaceae bacterium]